MKHALRLPALLAIALLAACSTLTPANPGAASADWQVLRQSASEDVRIRPATPPRAFVAPRLGKVRFQAADKSEDAAELETLRQSLADSLKQELASAPASTAAPTLNVTLSDPRPVSPVLNVASALLLFVPLDTGAISVEAELVAPDGARIAIWRERLSGGVLDISGSLSRWARVRNALTDWAKRCAHQPPWSSGEQAS
ncbi:hypothetical protein [Niveibacterium terrae]|uniref:hypothetical protein n=1 Tax=Niveibacterium terrae TaxID=3373598 RepID=UPI003A8CFC75